MRRNILIVLSFLIFGQLYGQEISFKVEISTDSILMGNYFEVRFTIEDASGDFEAPQFEGFEILSGPNTSSSFSMINGQVSQSASYSYTIRPVREGTLYIDPAAFTSGDIVLETEPVLIQVYPNPGGIQENKPFLQNGFDRIYETKPRKKKRSKFDHKKRKI